MAAAAVADNNQIYCLGLRARAPDISTLSQRAQMYNYQTPFGHALVFAMVHRLFAQKSST
jgi:hypothetical protein